MSDTAKIRELARNIVALRQDVNSLAANQSLRYSSIENGGSLVVKDSTGNTVVNVGGQWDGTYGAQPLVGPVPPTPTKPIVTGGSGILTVRWDGTFTDSLIVPMDFSRVEVHVGTVPEFDAASATTLMASIETPRGAEVVIGSLQPGDYYVRLVCRSTPGKAGPVSPSAGPVSVLSIDESPAIIEAQRKADAALAAADSAVTKAQDAEAAADGKVTTYLQASAPVQDQPDHLSVGDLWFDTSDSNKLYRWSGSVWEVAADQAAAQALSDAQKAMNDAASASQTANNAANAAADAQQKASDAFGLADSKIVTYYQDDAPGVNVSRLGDLWFDTNDNMRPYRYDGTVWRDVRDTTISIAQQRADTAYQLAGNKGKVYYQSNMPSAQSTPTPVTGDLWYNTSNFTLYQYNGTTWNPAPLDASQNIKANTITASLLAAQIVLASTLVAGPLNDAHAEISNEGISLFQKTGDGVVRTSRLGSTSGDEFLQVFSRSTGKVVASLNQNGNLTSHQAQIGTKPGDTFINGRTFESYIDPIPRGVISWGQRSTGGGQTYKSEQKWLEVQTMLQPNRLYQITLNPLYLVSSNAWSKAVLRIRYSTGGTPVTTSSVQGQSMRMAVMDGDGYSSPPLTFMLKTGATAMEHRFLATYDSEGTGYITPVASSGYPSIMLVEDKGPAIAQVGIDFGVSSPPVTKQNYVTYWAASQSQTYNGSNNPRTDIGQEIVHGYDPSGYNGNQLAMILFNGGAYSSNNGSENGKTIATALSGATITGVEMFIKNHHWYYNGGGTLCYLPGTFTSMPPTLTNADYVNSADFGYGEGRYITLPAQYTTSVCLGRPPSTSLGYYGRFDGVGQGDPPVLRISYTR